MNIRLKIILVILFVVTHIAQVLSILLGCLINWSLCHH